MRQSIKALRTLSLVGGTQSRGISSTAALGYTDPHTLYQAYSEEQRRLGLPVPVKCDLTGLPKLEVAEPATQPGSDEEERAGWETEILRP
ncbi:MAG: hypothetical protein P1U34_03465 [Coxiellaceae bacterium]|nr:hypothetical protein [Coxiellaceae bacterium]